MIPNETLQTVETIGATQTVGNFHITDATQARILVSLSDKMYTRKELAVVREYSTNAADAHIVVNKPINQVQVSLPTMTDLNFRIRDFGTGLTEAEIRDVYCVFGESTKRNSNKLNGVLGYGCKAGFAHADSFTVTSWIHGEKSVYQCIKGDSTKLHSAIRLSREASTEPSGIEVCVPVKQSSMWTFHREAINFYKYWTEMPTINNLTDEEEASLKKFREVAATLKGEGWEVRPKSDGSAQGVAFMGYVPYAIDWNTLYHKMSLDAKSRTLFELLQSNDVVLYFDMGEVQFIDSREQLEYTDKTFDALVSRIKEIFSKIKASIQEKFDPLPTIWDAKIMYNAIFGTGVLELEKGETDTGDVAERIKILDGNLMQLERTFENAFKWNGITLDGACFKRINRFDNNTPGKLMDKDHDPISPVMVTYRKKKSRVKANRCKAESNNGITASNKVAVIVNDTGRKTGQAMVARYLLFGAPTKYQTVYVLTFTEAKTQKEFNDFYNFETVPTQNLSDLIEEAKKWNNANKVTRNYGGGSNGTRSLMFVNVEEEKLEESEVPIRELEEGGIYVEVDSVSRRRRWRSATYHVKTGQYYTIEIGSVLDDIKKLVEELDLDVDRIYIINKQTQESKWFAQAKESGEWTNFWTLIDENLANLTVNVTALVDAENYEQTTVVCKEAAELLVPQILDQNSPLLKLIATVGNKNYESFIAIVDAFKGLRLWDKVKGETKGTVDYTVAEKAAKQAYPFLSWSDIENDYAVTKDKMETIARYVNAMDLYADLTRDTTAKPVAA